MIKLDRVDMVLERLVRDNPEPVVWREELDSEIREKINAKRTTDY